MEVIASLSHGGKGSHGNSSNGAACTTISQTAMTRDGPSSRRKGAANFLDNVCDIPVSRGHTAHQ